MTTSFVRQNGPALPSTTEPVERPGWLARILDRDTNAHYRTLVQDQRAAIETINKQELGSEVSLHMEQCILGGAARADGILAAHASAPSVQQLGPDIHSLTLQMLTEANTAVTKAGLRRLVTNR